MSAELVLTCQRIGCDEVEVIDLFSYACENPVGLDRVVREEWPEQWGWDPIGVDVVLHCPEHRSTGKALLDAATEIARAEVRPGIDPRTAENIEIIADALAAPGGEG